MGLLLVVDLGSGFASAALALVCLGIRCVVISVDWSEEAKEVACACFPNIVHASAVADFKAEWLRPVLQRRQVSAICVGGGYADSLC